MAAEQEVPQGTLDFIYQATRDGTDSQSRDIDAMDQKTISVLAAGSIVIGLASFARDSGGDAVTGLLALALGAYAVCAVASIIALRVREFFMTSHADQLWPNYYDAQPEVIKHALVEEIATAYGKNRALIKNKANACQVAIYALGAEAFLVGTSLILIRLAP